MSYTGNKSWILRVTGKGMWYGPLPICTRKQNEGNPFRSWWRRLRCLIMSVGLIVIWYFPVSADIDLFSDMNLGAVSSAWGEVT